MPKYHHMSMPASVKVDSVNLSSLLCQTPLYTQIRVWELCARMGPTQPLVFSSVLTRLPQQPLRSRTTRYLATPSPLGTRGRHKSPQSVFRDFPLFASSSAFYPPSLVGSGKSSKIAEILKIVIIASVKIFVLVGSRSSPIFS